MISILIPTFNRDCTQLVADLNEQGQALMKEDSGFDYEILVGDDASEDRSTLEINRKINAWSHCRLIEFAENLGRAVIRNKLAEAARFTYIIFMDNDAQVCSPHFLQRYKKAASGNPVVVGGLFNVRHEPSPAVSLRYRYEEAAQYRWKLSYRRKHPYASFATFNFLIQKKLFLGIRFDERCKRYGYEDTLFGFELERRGIPILHIENRLIHTGLEPNAVFLQKTETALHTLFSLDEGVKSRIRISHTAEILCRIGLGPALRACHWLFGRRAKKNLCGENPSLFIFKLYKLGFYLTLRSSDCSA